MTLPHTYRGTLGDVRGGIMVARAAKESISDTVMFLPNKSKIIPPNSRTGTENKVAYVIELIVILAISSF